MEAANSAATTRGMSVTIDSTTTCTVSISSGLFLVADDPGIYANDKRRSLGVVKLQFEISVGFPTKDKAVTIA